jgi:hypothetical protein
MTLRDFGYCHNLFYSVKTYLTMRALQTESSVDGSSRGILDTKICHKENIFANGFLKYYPLA